MRLSLRLPICCLVTIALAAAAEPTSGLKPGSASRTSAIASRHGIAPVAEAAPALRSVAAGARDALREPTAMGFINAMQVYAFTEGSVYHVYTAPGQVTDIVLQPGETLGAVASGDTVRWIVGDTSSGTGKERQVHILVKPIAPGLSTNLVITTALRTYHLLLTSTDHWAMAGLSWSYPQSELLAIDRPAEPGREVSPPAEGLDVTGLHFDYIISGDRPNWRPLRAFDDGRQTFIEFPADIAVHEAPPLFLVATKGAPELVNYRVRGRFYVVDRLFDVAELRLGVKHQDVVRLTRATVGGRTGRGA